MAATGIHYVACPYYFPGSLDEPHTAKCAACDAIDHHSTDTDANMHDIITDSPMEADSEDVIWCNDCNVTVWYVDSETTP